MKRRETMLACGCRETCCCPLQGPPTRIMAGLLDRIERLGPQVATAEEKGEMDRLAQINYGYTRNN